MELKPNMYARTNKGTIFKINSTLEIDIDGQWYKDGEADRVFKDLIFDIGIFEKVEKASHNIIDLIEVEDYVNGSKVIEISEYNGEKYVYVEETEYSNANQTDINVYYKNEYIETIVTKEQFEAMAYKVVQE